MNLLNSSQNQNITFSYNKGNKWTDDEETLLLKELSNNINISSITQSHGRTITRRKLIAYNLFNNNISIDIIIMKTKINEKQIMKTIQCKQIFLENKKIILKNKIFFLENKINDMNFK